METSAIAESRSACDHAHLRHTPVDYRRAHYEACRVHPKATDISARRWRYYRKKFPKNIDLVLSCIAPK